MDITLINILILFDIFVISLTYSQRNREKIAFNVMKNFDQLLVDIASGQGGIDQNPLKFYWLNSSEFSNTPNMPPSEVRCQFFREFHHFSKKTRGF